MLLEYKIKIENGQNRSTIIDTTQFIFSAIYNPTYRRGSIEITNKIFSDTIATYEDTDESFLTKIIEFLAKSYYDRGTLMRLEQVELQIKE